MAARTASGRVPNEAWRGRLWKTTACGALDVENDQWAAVTEVGDRSWGEPESTPLHGLRVMIFDNERHARIASANALRRHPIMDGERPKSLGPFQRLVAERTSFIMERSTLGFYTRTLSKGATLSRFYYHFIFWRYTACRLCF